MPSFQSISIVVCLLVCGLLYGILDTVIDDIEWEMYQPGGSGSSIGPGTGQGSDHTARRLIGQVWDYAPLLFFGAVAVYGLATSQKQY